MDHRSPLDSIFNVIGTLPQGHDKPVKQALYNSVAFFLLFICCAAGYAVYMILEPFIKPLMWAVLVGSALHPMKNSLRLKFQSWFQTLDTSNTPVILGVLLLPLNVTNEVAEFLGENLWKRLKLIIAVCVAIPVIHFIYYYTPKVIVTIVWKSVVWNFQLLTFFLDNSSLYMVSSFHLFKYLLKISFTGFINPIRIFKFSFSIVEARK